MNKIIILSMGLLLLNGCSQKVTSVNKECQNIECKILDLKQEKSLNLTSKIANVMINGYPYGQSSKEITQKIKVLSMELDECQRKSQN